jgi:antitoxin FitA
MRDACVHQFHMSTMIQIRDVPETLHRQLKSRAALAGMSLSGYLLDEIRRIASQPTIAELRARMAQRPAVDPAMPPAEAVRAERDRL